MMQWHDTGLRSDDFASFFAAIHILQLCPHTKGKWNGSIFQINEDPELVIQHIVANLKPIPILTPGNRSGGFFEGGSKAVSNCKHVSMVRNSDCDRLATVRPLVHLIDQVIADTGYNPFTSDKDAKDEFNKAIIAASAESFDSEILTAWMHVLFTLGDSDEIKMNPTAGKAGAEGTGEYSKTYWDAFFHLFSPDGNPTEKCELMLRSLVLGLPAPVLEDVSIGRYSPSGGIGTKFGIGTPVPRVNPWKVVLLFGGLLMLSSTRSRHDGDRGIGSPAIPFAVRSSPYGYTAATTSNEAELEYWLPLWDTAATHTQLKALFRQGRSRLDDRPAQSGMEFVQALPYLEQTLGIRRFARFVAMGRASEKGNGWMCFVGVYSPADEATAAALSDVRSWCYEFSKATQSTWLADQFVSTVSNPTLLPDLARSLGKSLFATCGQTEQALSYKRPKLSRAWFERLNAEYDCPEFRLAAAIAKHPFINWKTADLVDAAIAANREWAKHHGQCDHRERRFDSYVRFDDLEAFIDGYVDDWRIIEFARFLSRTHLNGTGKNAAFHLEGELLAVLGVWHCSQRWCLDSELRLFPYDGQVLTGLASGHGKPAMDIALSRLRQCDRTRSFPGASGFDLSPTQCRRWAAALAFNVNLSFLFTLISEEYTHA